MKFEVAASDGRIVHVDANDWTMAMARAMPVLGVQASGWMCMTGPDGVTQVIDAASGASFRVKKLGDDALVAPTVTSEAGPPSFDLRPEPEAVVTSPPAPVREQIAPAGGSARRRPPVPVTLMFDRGAAPVDDDDAPPAPLPTPPKRIPRPAPKVAPSPLAKALDAGPDLWTPKDGSSRGQASKRGQRLTEPPPDNLAERLFDLSTDIYLAGDVNSACRMALEILMQLVPCEAGSVLRGRRDAGMLTFVAVAGPAEKQLTGKKMHFGQGVVGAAFDLGIHILVDDVAADSRHLPRFDEETGFQTRSVLCVPILQGYEAFGAVELVNPRGGSWHGWHVEAVASVAATLAGLISESGA